MSRPEVSVCIPAYRAAAHLSDAIESVLAQTYPSWELVIVDNASDDDTGRIAAHYAARDPRIRVVTNPVTVGIADNWNLAVDRAEGHYVKLLPADDILQPECLELQLKDFESHPGTALVASRRDFVDADGTLVLAGRGLHGLLGEVPAAEVVRRVVACGLNPIGEPAAYLFRRDDFFAVGAFDPSLPYPLDLSLAVRLLQRGAFYGQSTALAAFRVRGDSYTAGDIHAQGLEHRILLRRLGNDPRWAIGRLTLWRGLALTFVAGAKRSLLYRAASSRRRALRRLPGLVLRPLMASVVSLG